MYDPTIGRWISEDPIGFTAGDPNLYRYVGNSPTNFTDPSGLQPVIPNQQPAGPVFGAPQLRELIGLSGATDESRERIFDLSMFAAEYESRGESLTPATASAVFYGWERTVNRGFPTVGMGAGVRSTAPLESAVDRVAANVLREIDRRTVDIATAVSHARLLSLPTGVNSIAADISYAFGVDSMARTQFRRLDAGRYQDRADAQNRLAELLFAQPLIVAEILANSPTNSPEQTHRRNMIVDVPRLRAYERLNSNVFRKYAEAIFREYLRPLPEADVNRILAANPDAGTPNHVQLMRLIRGR